MKRLTIKKHIVLLKVNVRFILKVAFRGVF